MHNNKNAEEAAPKFVFYTAREMEERPAPEQLISGILPVGSFCELFGPPGIGKSFILLDIAFSVATGAKWHNSETKRVPVVYVLAEGSGAIGRRITAWRKCHNLSTIPNIHFLPQVLRLDDSKNVREFIKTLNTLPAVPGMIVVDTLSRCIPGVEENSSKEMGAVVQNIDLLRQETGSAVLLCHHTTKNGNGDRGSSVIRGAADVMICVRADKHSPFMNVECDKAKDLSEFDPFILVRTPYADSCVVQWGGLASDKKHIVALPDSQKRLLEMLALTHATIRQMPSGDLKKLSNLKERTFYDAIKALVAKEYVKREDILGITAYTITRAGAEVLRGMCNLGANVTPVPTDVSVHAIPPSLEGDCSCTVTEPGDSQKDGPDSPGEGITDDLP